MNQLCRCGIPVFGCVLIKCLSLLIADERRLFHMNGHWMWFNLNDKKVEINRENQQGNSVQ